MQTFKPKKTHKKSLNSEKAHAHPWPYFILEKHTLETYKSNKLVYKDRFTSTNLLLVPHDDFSVGDLLI